MGFWIREDGKTFNIPDHYNFIRENPKLFGFTQKEEKSWTLADRNGVIEESTRRGWIRVRGRSPHMSFEFWRLNGDVIFNIKQFLIAQGIDPDEEMLFEQNEKADSWYKPASWMLADEALVMAGRVKRGRG